MTRLALLIGIGAGDPAQVTMAAVDAMASVDTFFVLDKPSATELTTLRTAIVNRYVGPNANVVTIADPPRDRSAESGEHRPSDAYRANVATWHADRAALLARAITEHVPDGGTAGFLVWGDPSLYDSTLRVVQRVAQSVPLTTRVIPGITSVQALTAAHTILLNRIGEPIHITTGRLLAGDDGRNTVVMLDADCTFQETARPTDHIYWGAYLGTEHEILIEGTVGEVGETIVAARAAARERHGWIMDIYLLRRPDAVPEP